MRRIIVAFFHLLYHQLAWGYDLIAWLVSLGRWQAWGQSILPLLPRGHILELGFGPGHLQIALHERGCLTYGIDESAQMNTQARRRLSARGLTPRLARSLAQALPFASASFEAAVATFPPPFLFEPATALEIERTLKPGGRLLALLAFRPYWAGPADIAIRTLFTLTGQLPPRAFDPKTLEAAYIDAGLEIQAGWHSTPSGEMLLIDAVKPLEIRSHLR